MSLVDNSFTMYNDAFVVVKPVEALMNSRTISGAVNRGGVFAVNLRTSELTIFSKYRLLTEGYTIDETGKVVRGTPVRTPVFTYRSKSGEFYTLPGEFLQAEAALKANMGSISLVFSDQEVTPVGQPKTLGNLDRDAFVEKVRLLYQKAYRKAAAANK